MNNSEIWREAPLIIFNDVRKQVDLQPLVKDWEAVTLSKELDRRFDATHLHPLYLFAKKQEVNYLHVCQALLNPQVHVHLCDVYIFHINFIL